MAGRAHAPSQPLGFFTIAVAYSIGWTCICSELARYAANWGPSILLQLNLAYYVPSVPLLLAQTILGWRFDNIYGQHRCNLLRVSVGFGGCAVVLAVFPFLQHSLSQLLAAVAALGACSSIAFGSSFALCSKFDNSSTVANALGFVASAPVVLLVEAVLRITPACSWHQRLWLYEVMAAISAAGLVAAVAILVQYRRWRHQQREQQLAGLAEPLLLAEAAAPAPAPLQDSSSTSIRQQLGGSAGPADLTGASAELQLPLPPADASLPLLGQQHQDGSLMLLLDDLHTIDLDMAAGHSLAAVWPAAVSLGLAIGASQFLFPLFPLFPSTGRWGMMLPVILFWVRCFADIAGRLLPKLAHAPPSGSVLLSLAVLRVALLPLAILYIQGHLPLRSDFLLAVYVGLQWLLGGALTAWAFLLAQELVPAALGPQAASAMALTFNICCLAGLLCNIPMHALLPS